MFKLTIFCAAISIAAFFSYGKNVTFIKGKVEFALLDADETNSSGTLDINSSINNQVIGTSTGSRIQIESNDKIWRLGTSSTAQFVNSKHVYIFNGSVLFCFTESFEITIETLSSNATFRGKGTFLIETTSNGGFKFIPIEINGILTTDLGDTKELRDGRMLLVLNTPSELGNAYDIDLLLLLKSSRLINSFPSNLPSMDQISLAVYKQQLKLKGKYDALIGDATSNKNLQMWKFGKKAGVKPSTSQNPESKKGFFKSFFGKE